MATVTVRVPAERVDAIRGVASLLEAGSDLIVLRRPPGLADAALPAASAECVLVLVKHAINSGALDHLVGAT